MWSSLWYVPEYGVKPTMQLMTIGQLAAAAGVNVETVRYYQRRELLAQPKREPGSIRKSLFLPPRRQITRPV